MLPHMSLRKFATLNGALYPRFSYDDMLHNLAIFDIDPNIKSLSSLSMGQKKKVLMSFAFATHTDLMLMDEPTNGLDIPGKSQFRRLVASQMSDDRTIIISTHQVRDIDRCIDHVVIIDQQIALCGEWHGCRCRRCHLLTALGDGLQPCSPQYRRR